METLSVNISPYTEMKLLAGIMCSRSPSSPPDEQDVNQTLVSSSDDKEGIGRKQDKDKVTRRELEKMETIVDIGTDCPTDTLSWRDTAFVVFTFISVVFIIFGFTIAYGRKN